jgi:hypothetical protein
MLDDVHTIKAFLIEFSRGETILIASPARMPSNAVTRSIDRAAPGAGVEP